MLSSKATGDEEVGEDDDQSIIEEFEERRDALER